MKPVVAMDVDIRVGWWRRLRIWLGPDDGHQLRRLAEDRRRVRLGHDLGSPGEHRDRAATTTSGCTGTGTGNSSTSDGT
ncbi:hypothetical protein ABZ345_07245 [Lentzea sp. NPDC005914]|uniref:hypothetical protein n=1 Tax=Lentzea sp. NPDC005914 TaxID=3154572 RepID=UPI0033F0163A